MDSTMLAASNSQNRVLQLVAMVNVTSSTVLDATLRLHNVSTNDSIPGRPWPGWIRTSVIPLFFGIVCFLGILGNGTVIAVLLRFNNMRTVPNIYILNLAFADLLFMFSIPFLAFQYATSNWVFGQALCKIVFAVDGMNMFTGIFILTAMSIDRYFAIVHGITSIKYRTVRNARMINCCMWLLSILVTLPLWIYSSTVSTNPQQVKCDIVWPKEVFSMYFTIYAFVLGFALPVTIISGCYLSLVIYIVRSKGPRSENPRKSTGSRKVALLVLSVVAMFVICWLPFYVIQFVLLSNQDVTLAIYISYYSSLCLSYANSCLNPIVYTFAGENFRKNLSKICHRRRRKRRKIQRGRRVVKKGIFKKASRMSWTLANFSSNDNANYGNTLGTAIELDTTTTTTESCQLTTYSDIISDEPM
ncbi:somatostatin receptor type 2-like [Saccoglossus kowalevskii]|uniref:Somatostatin receptor type 2-like n=1 Tax=Saccoglossus kowalevskii TaxID=10224 RepID=A0ABM0GU47_SACKO|nr:PREDICTED: somatostatin receptor type 2-like [Saccoglossus kowalevskii]